MDIKPAGQMVKTSDGSKNRTGIIRADSPGFADALKDSEVEKRRKVCADLLHQISSLTEELKKTPSPEGVKRYRDVVTSFMKEALNQSYQLDQHTHWDRNGNRKNMVIVKQVNDSLEELMDMVTKEGQPQLKLVSKLDQIRGLLLDLSL